MYQKNGLTIVVISLLVMLTSCTQTQGLTQSADFTEGYPTHQTHPAMEGFYPSPLEPNALPRTPSDPPKPEAGKGSISGVLYSFTIDMVLPETTFYLTEAIVENGELVPPILVGPQPDKGELVFKTGKKGEISLNGIQPGNYLLVVAAPYSWEVVVESEDNPQARLLEIIPDSINNLGTMFLSWP